jgi:anaerobic selenocysteine-containing dehydrogenase
MDDARQDRVEDAPENAEELPDKADIKAALSLIPPASALKAEEKRLTEKRIRILYDHTLKPEEAKINPRLAKELGITEKLEIVVAGRHRFAFRAILDDDVEYGKVHVNPELMEEHGIADNSIATVRAYRGTEKLGVRLEV